MKQDDKIELANGTKIPIIGLGTWKLTGKNCVESVKKALALGYRHIDTAEIYGNEKEVGEGIKGFNRSELFITTKFWPEDWSHDSVMESAKESIAKLGSAFIDLYLVHWPKKNENIREIFTAFKKLQDGDLVRAIGVSNFTINHLKDTLPVAEELGLKIATNQVEFHPLLYQKELLEFCKENDIVVTAYSPIARGEVMKNSALKEIGEAHEKTAAQVSLKWLLQKGLVAIPKSGSEKHLEENINIFDFGLSKEEIKKIDAINENKRQVNPPFSEFEY